MRGFAYLIEVVIAGLLTAMALAAFLSTTTVRTNWERPELVSLGDSMLWSLEDSGQLGNILSGNTTNISHVMPFNVKWALQVVGTPKSNITVGCVCDLTGFQAVQDALKPSYINGRWVNYTVDRITWPTEGYDVVVFTSTINFDNDVNVQNYIASGHGVVAVVNMTGGDFTNMDQTFGLTSSAGSASATLPFTPYAPATNKVAKYFFGLGMPVATPTVVGSKHAGTWKLWQVNRQVNITSGLAVEIEGAAPSSVIEDGTFNMTGPSGVQVFKLKKVWPDSSGMIAQAVVPNFSFINFAADDATKVTGRTDIVSDGVMSAMTANGSAIWMSGWPQASSEYDTLLSAAVASLTTEWWLAEPLSPRQPVNVISFVPLCCDTPETAELVLWLWYAF